MIKTRVDMGSYVPTELNFPSAAYLGQLKNIEEKDIPNNDPSKNGGLPYKIWEITYAIINGVDASGRQKVVTLQDSIFLNNEYTQDSIFRMFSKMGLVGAQLSNPELAIGRYVIIDYVCKADMQKSNPTKIKVYPKFRYRKYDEASKPSAVKIIGQVIQPTLSAAPVQPVAPIQAAAPVQPVQPVQPVYAQQVQPGFQPAPPVQPQYAQPVATQQIQQIQPQVQPQPQPQPQQPQVGQVPGFWGNVGNQQ
jgi:hypothetical protein